jgi:glycosyltransferase involved in cell wall biosynthesis
VSLSFAIVTPSLSQGEFVERTVQSVLDQAYAPLEYVVCDGGSTDTTLPVLEPYRDRLRIVSEPDSGQAAAVNKGIQLSSGEIIGWLNSDDVYRPGALRAAANVFAAQPLVDVVYGNADIIDEHDAVLRPYYTEPWNARRLPDRCFLAQPAVFFRRRVVERFGLLDERLHFCMDYEYWLRLAAGGAVFAYIPQTLAATREHPRTKTLSARAAYHAELNGMLRGRLGSVPATWLHNHAHTLVELNRARARTHLTPYALDVIIRSLALSLRWNRSISVNLLRVALAPIVHGARRRIRQRRRVLLHQRPT